MNNGSLLKKSIGLLNQITIFSFAFVSEFVTKLRAIDKIIEIVIAPPKDFEKNNFQYSIWEHGV